MSLNEEIARVQVTVSTATDVISFAYPFGADTELVVVSNARGTLVLNANYTVSGAGEEAGGTVTLIDGVENEVVTVIRSTAISQLLQLLENGPFPSTSIEASLDKLTKILQDLNETVARSLRLPVAEIDGYVSELAVAATRAGKYLGFNLQGEIVYLDGTVNPSDDDVSLFAADPSSNISFNPTEWRSDLSLIVGTHVQAWSAVLDATTASYTTAEQSKLAGITSGAEPNDPNTLVSSDIGSTVQAFSTVLTQIGAVVPAQYDVLEYNGSTWVARDGNIASSQVLIRTAADIPATIDGTKTYIVDGPIDVAGITSRTIDATGANFRGSGAPNSGFVSTEAGQTLFVSDGGGSGTVVFDSLSNSFSGSGSKLFDCSSASGTNIFAILDCSFIACDSVGTVTGFGVVIHRSTQHINCVTGITLAGTMLDVEFDSSAFTGTLTSGVDIMEGASLSITRRFQMQGCVATVGSGAILCNIQASNIVEDAGCVVFFNDVSGDGTFFSNLDGDNVKCRWRDNNWAPVSSESNTYVGAQWRLTSEAVTPATLTNPVKLLGTTTYSDEAWFSNTDNNAFTYDSSRNLRVVIQGIVALECGNNNQVVLKLRLWDASDSVYVDLWDSPYITTNGVGRGENVSVLTFATIDQGDRIELWARNDSDNDDITLLLNSELTVTERAN